MNPVGNFTCMYLQAYITRGLFQLPKGFSKVLPSCMPEFIITTRKTKFNNPNCVVLAKTSKVYDHVSGYTIYNIQYTEFHVS